MNDYKELIKQTKEYLRKYDYNKVISNCDKILEVYPESTFGLRFKGISLLQTDNYEKAIDYYEKLHSIKPKDNDALFTLAHLYEKTGNFEKSLYYYEKTSKTEKTISRRKRLLTKMKEYNRFIEYYDKKISQLDKIEITQPIIQRRIVYLEEKGVFQYRMHAYKEAYETFREVYSLFDSIENKDYFPIKNVSKWYCLLNDCLEKYSDYEIFFNKFLNLEDNSHIWFDKIKNTFSQYEDSLVFTDLLLELNPENMELLEVCGIKTRYIDDEYSVECFKKILEIDPENTAAIRKILDIYLNQYSKDKSLKLIDSKLYIDELRPDLLVRKINILQSMTLYDEAIETYDEYLSIEKPDGLINNPLTVFDKIRCMEQKALDLYLVKEYQESYNTLHEVSKIFQNTTKDSFRILSNQWHIESWYNNILLESLNKSNDDATVFFKEFFTIEDNHLDLWLEKINFLIDYRHYGNPIAYCEILLDKEPENTRILLTKAFVYYRTRRLSYAYDTYNDILKLEQENNEAKNYKFNILVQWQEYSKAYKLLKNMKIKYTVIRHYLSNLAKTFLDENKYEEALTCYKIILKENHDISTVDKIKFIWNKTDNYEDMKNCKFYMDWINLIEYKHEENVCPDCGNNLIPIVYGLIAFDDDTESKIGTEYVLGGCCVSYDSPTDYCNHCQKEVNLGTYGVVINQEDHQLYRYTISKIRWIKNLLEEENMNLNKFRHESSNEGFDNEESDKFLEKLEDINFIRIEDNTIMLVEDYNKFTDVL